MQEESDAAIDYRGLLHRDGTVLSAVTLADLATPEELYRKLGCKLAVGMPFKVSGAGVGWAAIWVKCGELQLVSRQLGWAALWGPS